MKSFSEYLRQHLAPSTQKRYEKELEAYRLHLKRGRVTPLHAQYPDIMKYLGALREKQKGQLHSCHLAAIKKYYDYLQHTEQRKDHPARSIRLKDKRKKDIQLQDLFTPQELESLLKRKERYALLKNKNKIVLSLLIYQGLTSGEITRIKLKDIQLEEGTVYIQGGRKSNARSLKLSSKQVFWIMAYLNKDRPLLVKKESDYLIIGKRGFAESGEGIAYLVKTQQYRFPDRRLNPQTIRQSVIANLLKEKKDLRLVQAFAGHRNPSTTEKYKQSQLEELKNQVLKYHPLDQL